MKNKRYNVTTAAWDALSRTHLVVRFSPGGKITWCNPAFLEVTGYQADELLGQRHEILCAEHEWDSKNYRDLWERLRSGQDDSGIYVRKAKDGSERWLQATYSPVFNAVGGVRSILKIATDITQARLERADIAGRMTAIDNANFLLDIDWNGHILAVNEMFLAATGYRRGELIGIHIHEICQFDHKADRSREVRSRVENGQVANGKVEILTACGRKIWMQTTFNTIYDAAGRPAKILLLGSDVTEQSRLESELANARAETSAKSSFLANMSHEVRTPMAGVMGFAELLRDSALDCTQRRQVEMIIDSGEKMMQLLNDILDVSKIGENKLEIVAAPMNLREWIEKCVELMSPAADHKGLMLRMVIDESLPDWIEGDSMRIRQILLNLIGNAIKFTRDGMVTVRVERDPESSANYVIEVVDTGIGIPKAMLEKVTAKFIQADPTVQSDFGGSGLGLTISSELARLMGGRLEIESSQNLGTRVVVSLPLTAAESQAGMELKVELAETEDLHRSDAPRILVAEDYDINQLLIEEQLEKLGVRCEIAEDGEHALRMVDQARQTDDPYRLVLMDLRMPKLDGYAAAKALRAAGHTARELPIVALTANAYEEDIAACMIAGMQGHLAKPTSLERLSMVIAQWVPPEDRAAGDAPVESVESKSRFERTRDKYLSRRAELFEIVEQLSESAASVDAASLSDLAERLHKLSGTAALFGEERLGQVARELESVIRSAEPETGGEVIVDAKRRLYDAA